MPLVKVAQLEPIRDLDELFRAVLKYIFVYTNKWYLKNNLSPDLETMTTDEVNRMQYSVDWWYRVELKRLKDKTERKIWLFKVTADEIDREHEKYVEQKLQLIGFMLKKNDDGKFDMTKEQYYFKSIDYRKAYRLPEAYTEKDFAWGKQVGLESDIREGIKPRVK